MSSEESKATAFGNLCAIKQELDELGIFFWLDGGTLLGAVRDGDFCEDDENDVDLSAWAADKDKIPELVERMRGRGFRLYHHWVGDERAPGMAQEVSFARDGLKIDVFFQETKGNVVWHLIYVRERGNPVVVPKRLLEGFDNLWFRGVGFNIPMLWDEYLTFRYGDWRTPIHRSEYSSTKTHQFLALQPDWPFWT